ncbi:MAG TPA: PD-(D/E)XK nuclease family protein, partial [bacterium]|nr:PD-(D/E)XK nuclease family protein [bacterium]
YLQAVMDLVFLEAGGWVIVDYKTDRDPGERREAYEKQIALYAELLAQATGLPVKETALLFLRETAR